MDADDAVPPSPEGIEPDPAQATLTLRPAEASTTRPKSVSIVTGVDTTSPAAFPSHAPTAVTETVARPAPSVVITEDSSEACSSTRELSTAASPALPPAATRTPAVFYGPSEKESPLRPTVNEAPSLTGSLGSVTPIADLSDRGVAPE